MRSVFSVLCGSIDWASKIFYCFFCHFWAQNQFECVPDVVCKGLLCVQFSLKFSVVYLSSSLLQFTIESRDLSQAEKKITLVTSWVNSPNKVSTLEKICHVTSVRLWLLSEWALKKIIQILPEPDAGHVTCFLYNYDFNNTFQLKLLFFLPEPFWSNSVVIWSACNNSKRFLW